MTPFPFLFVVGLTWVLLPLLRDRVDSGLIMRGDANRPTNEPLHRWENSSAFRKMRFAFIHNFFPLVFEFMWDSQSV